MILYSLISVIRPNEKYNNRRYTEFRPKKRYSGSWLGTIFELPPNLKVNVNGKFVRAIARAWGDTTMKEVYERNVTIRPIRTRRITKKPNQQVLPPMLRTEVDRNYASSKLNIALNS